MEQNPDKIPQDIQALIDHFALQRLPVEGTLYRNTYKSSETLSSGRHYGTAMLGLYSEYPLSVSCFHRLDAPEVWHFYAGDPIELHLLFPNGECQTHLLGSDWKAGQKLQFVVPAGVWQGGCVAPGGRYGLFGCTMAPGFSAPGFEAAAPDKLIAEYPQMSAIIRRLSVNGDHTQMPEGFSD